jgi:gamma-glutamyl hercynylcysteine S-oxide synthase
VLEPENGGNPYSLETHKITWGYFRYPEIPCVAAMKWLERRHMIHICERFNLNYFNFFILKIIFYRWEKDHTNQLQSMFFNGIGFESWENVWGIWMGMNPRDSECNF